MSGIAEVLLNLGYKVSGSDLKANPLTERLRGLGALTFEGHRAENVHGTDVVVTSSAIARDNPEVAEAQRLKLPIIARAEMLAELMRLKYGVAIAGMHGKTTTTSMVAAVLAAGGLDPTAIIGGRVEAMGSNARVGKSQYLVAEADESDRSFLKLSPILSVVTNIDREHMDCYRDMADIEDTFVEFMERVPFYGMVVACVDDAPLTRVLPRVSRRVVTYGKSPAADFRVSALEFGAQSGCMSQFRVRYGERDLGAFRLSVPGAHNVLNATAAIAVGLGLDIAVPAIHDALENFRGVDRRFQLKGTAAGVAVVDDYGHHPTEIRATLAAARQCGYKRVHVIFQPHRYTRTQALLDEFATAFNAADAVAVLDVYAASEAPIPGISGELVAARINDSGQSAARYCASFADATAWAAEHARAGDLVLTLGAGNVSQLGPQVLAALGTGRTSATGTAD